eukprot:1609399-Ditylum_brightwellii.AAC.1
MNGEASNVTPTITKVVVEGTNKLKIGCNDKNSEDNSTILSGITMDVQPNNQMINKNLQDQLEENANQDFQKGRVN